MINKKLNAYFNCHLNWIRIIGAGTTLQLIVAFATFGLVTRPVGIVLWLLALVLLPFTLKFATSIVSHFNK